MKTTIDLTELFLAEHLGRQGGSIWVNPDSGEIHEFDPGVDPVFTGNSGFVFFGKVGGDFPDDDFGVKYCPGTETWVLVEPREPGRDVRVRGTPRFDRHYDAALAAVSMWGADLYFDDIEAAIERAVEEG